MSLKSIRESYSSLLAAFEKSGIKLNESQKGELDTFIVGLETRMREVKESTVKATKKVVEARMNKEYQKVVESLMSNLAKHNILAGKILTKIKSINESLKMAKKLDNYLDLYVESILPKKSIVDYGRMQKLETLFESLKDTLLVNEDAVEAKKAKLTESFKSKKRDYETQIAKLQAKLNESMKKELALHKKIESAKAQQLLESKLADLPSYEARKLRKRFAGASVAEIEKKFSKILESVKDEIKSEADKEEVTLEKEVEDILEGDGCKNCTDEDDILKKCHTNGDGIHNGHQPLAMEKDDDDDANECDVVGGREHNGHQMEEDDDPVELKESEKIPSFLMNTWIDQYSTIETRGY